MARLGAIWPWIELLVGLYCLAQAVRDFRRHAYAWAVLGLLCAAALPLTPIQTHAVKLDIDGSH